MSNRRQPERLIIQSVDENWRRWLELSSPIHQAYAEAHDADYRVHIGAIDRHVHPAWNRIKMILDAFQAGYSTVVWLDADTLVVKPERSIFDELSDEAPLQMIRAGLQWRGHGSWNDGVLVANKGFEAIRCLEWVWARREFPLLKHMAPSLWELNWILDYLEAHPNVVTEISPIWNWQDFEGNPPMAEAVIMAWHGIVHSERFARFAATWQEYYGGPAGEGLNRMEAK